MRSYKSPISLRESTDVPLIFILLLLFSFFTFLFFLILLLRLLHR